MNKLDIKISWELFKDKLKSISKGKFGKFLKRNFTLEFFLVSIILIVHFMNENRTLEDNINTVVVVWILVSIDVLKKVIKDSEERILKAIKAKTDETKSST